MWEMSTRLRTRLVLRQAGTGRLLGSSLPVDFGIYWLILYVR